MNNNNNNKRTLARSIKYYGRKCMIKSVHNEIVLRDRNANIMLFSVGNDSKYLEAGNMVLPTIDMCDDNDNETEWNEIQECVGNMSLSLSICAYDKKYR